MKNEKKKDQKLSPEAFSKLLSDQCSQFAEHLQKAGVMCHIIAIPADPNAGIATRPLFMESWDKEQIYLLMGLLEQAKIQVSVDIVNDLPAVKEEYPQPVNQEPSDEQLQAEMDAEAAASADAEMQAASAEAEAMADQGPEG